MLYVTCPVCARSVYLDEIPERLPVHVPDHLTGEQMPTCVGAGRKSSAVWMVRPQSKPAISVG
jgi:hypothetical protein